jgi:peptide/nickel transport system permease protein
MLAGWEASDETVQEIRKDLGLTKPLLLQYIDYIWGILHGDFGKSYHYGTPVAEELGKRFPMTLLLASGGMFIAVFIGSFSGIVASVKRGSLLDQLSMVVALTGVCLPSFWIGLMLMFLLSVKLRWLPSTGAGSWKHLVLPALTLGIYGAGFIARLTRSSMLDVLNKDFIKVARAKGLSERAVIFKHALKNVFIPVLTIVGLQFGGFLGKAVLTESVFAWPGIARLIVTAVIQRDYLLIQGGVLWLAIAFSLINLATDILYASLDPRIRF